MIDSIVFWTGEGSHAEEEDKGERDCFFHFLDLRLER